MKKSKKINVPKRELKTRKVAALQDVKVADVKGADLRKSGSTKAKSPNLYSRLTKDKNVNLKKSSPNLNKKELKKSPDVRKTKVDVRKPFIGAKGLKTSTSQNSAVKDILRKKKK